MISAIAQQVCAPIAKHAGRADRRDGDLGLEIDLLRDGGWLKACLPVDQGGAGWGTEPDATESAFDALRVLGGANLSVARLFEGHMNAVKLLALYGSARQLDALGVAVRAGTLFGVWGADDPASPLKQQDDHLTGAKRFASGLELVDVAIVSVAREDGPQLLLVASDRPERADASAWNMAGMRATRSGTYDFSGVHTAPQCFIGVPGDYLREPNFEGGIWRYCAAHLGAAEALYDAMRQALTERGRAGSPHQQDRIVRCAIAIETARLWLMRAAREVEAADAPPRKAALSLAAREVTEDSCRTVMQLVEQSLGMAAHEEGSTVERIRCDLSLFLCQAAPDAKRARAAQTLIDSRLRFECL